MILVSVCTNIESIMDAQTYATIIQSVCSRIGVETPTNTITRNVISHCKKLNIRQLRNAHPDKNEFLLAIVKSYMDSLKPAHEFNFEEYLQNNKPIVDKNVSTTWLQSNMPIDASKSMSIFFDTRLRSVNNDNNASITNFGFSIVPRTMQAILGDGNIQVRVLPSQITYFKVGKFSIPYTMAMRAANFMKEITMTFTALTSNGILSNEQTYHFVFKYTEPNDSFVELTPINEFCKFCPPVRHLDDISLRISDPLIPIAFQTDRMTAASLNYLSADGRITLSNAHGLSTGDVVIIQSLSTSDNSVNAVVLSQINNPRGLPVTVINPTIISIGIDFTTIISPDPSSKPLIIFYSKTFRFPLEIGYQDIAELD